jgi:hypothetical protein
VAQHSRIYFDHKGKFENIQTFINNTFAFGYVLILQPAVQTRFANPNNQL